MKKLLCAVLVALYALSAGTQVGTRLNNNSGSTIAQYDVVVIDTGSSLSVETTTTEAAAGVVGVAYMTIANSSSGAISLTGAVLTHVTGTVAIGDKMVTSSTAGYARSAASAAEETMAFGIALEANASGNANKWVMINSAAILTNEDGGDLVYNASTSTDNALARFDSTTGKLVQNSVGILDDAGALTGITVNANVITAGTLGTARLGSGTANSSSFLRGDQTWAAPVAVLADADYGDITVSGTGTALTVDNTAITFAKMQAVSADVLLGNDSSGTAVEEISVTSAGRALLDDADASAQRTTLGGITVGAASSTDNAVVRFDSTTGKVIQNSSVTIDDSNNLASVANISATGRITTTGFIGYSSDSTLTISSGTITPTKNVHTVDTEGAASTDDLTTITGTTDGDILILRGASAARVVTVVDGSNLVLNGNFALSGTGYRLVLLYRSPNWCELSRSAN